MGQQNGFSEHDFMCPLGKTIGMMKVICHFHDNAQRHIAESSGDAKITWNVIKTVMGKSIVKVTDMKFELPRQPTSHFKNVYGQLIEELNNGFRSLGDHV